MNTQSNASVEASPQSQGFLPTAVAAARPFYWSVRRELWENRAIYLAPLAAAVVFLFGTAIHILTLRHQIQSGSPLDTVEQHLLGTHHELGSALIMGIAFIVGIFYSLDALYGERRDRSILFWKSLPVSDLTAVLSKLTIPLVILPLLSFAIAVAAQFITLLLSSVILLGSGIDIARLWTETSFFRVSLALLYHLLTVHGLWYAPLYAWIFLVSAWSRRAPFLWVFLPPFVICGLEKIAFNTSHFLALLQSRVAGPGDTMTGDHASMDPVAALIPTHFFSEPGLWIGLAVAALFLFGAVRLRRSQGPI